MSTTQDILSTMREDVQRRSRRTIVAHKGDRNVRVPSHMVCEEERYEQHQQRTGQLTVQPNGERRWSF